MIERVAGQPPLPKPDAASSTRKVATALSSAGERLRFPLCLAVCSQCNLSNCDSSSVHMNVSAETATASDSTGLA